MSPDQLLDVLQNFSSTDAFVQVLVCADLDLQLAN